MFQMRQLKKYANFSTNTIQKEEMMQTLYKFSLRQRRRRTKTVIVHFTTDLTKDVGLVCKEPIAENISVVLINFGTGSKEEERIAVFERKNKACLPKPPNISRIIKEHGKHLFEKHSNLQDICPSSVISHKKRRRYRN